MSLDNVVSQASVDMTQTASKTMSVSGLAQSQGDDDEYSAHSRTSHVSSAGKTSPCEIDSLRPQQAKFHVTIPIWHGR